MTITVRLTFRSGTVNTIQYDSWDDVLADLRDNKHRTVRVEIEVTE